jgi:hypothetical protein
MFRLLDATCSDTAMSANTLSPNSLSAGCWCGENEHFFALSRPESFGTLVTSQWRQRNRRASNYLQEDQCDRQTQRAGSFEIEFGPSRARVPLPPHQDKKRFSSSSGGAPNRYHMPISKALRKQSQSPYRDLPHLHKTRARSLYNLHNNATLFLRNLPIVSPQMREYSI